MKTSDVLAFAQKMSEQGPTLARDDLRALDHEVLISATLNLCHVLTTQEEFFQEAAELARKIANLAQVR